MGRHIRPRPYFKLIVSREAGENHYLEGYKRSFTHLFTVSHKGPLALIDGTLASTEDQVLAARIVARFSQGRDAAEVTVQLQNANGHGQVLNVAPLLPTEISQQWYV